MRFRKANPMPGLRRRLAAPLGCAFVILFVVVTFIFLRESEVNYHLRKLREAHLVMYPDGTAFDTLRRIKFTLGWKIPIDEFKKHQKALVQLGYFQNTNLAFSTPNLLREFVAEIKTLPLADTNWSYSIEGTNLLLTAATSDLHLWTTTASNLNATSTRKPSLAPFSPDSSTFPPTPSSQQ